MKKNLFIISIFVFTSFLHAQNEENSYKYWMTIGFWAHRDVNINANYCFSLMTNYYKVGYFMRGGLSEEPTTDEDGYLIQSIDLSIGKRLQSKWFQASLFGGPAFVFGKRRISVFNDEKFNTVGLETDIQLLFRLANEVGLGVGLYGNLNFIKNYAGININITLGNGK